MWSKRMGVSKPRREAWSGSCPPGPRKEPALLTASSQPPGHQVLFKPPSLWPFVTATPVNEYPVFYLSFPVCLSPYHWCSVKHHSMLCTVLSIGKSEVGKISKVPRSGGEDIPIGETEEEKQVSIGKC